MEERSTRAEERVVVADTERVEAIAVGPERVEVLVTVSLEAVVVPKVEVVAIKEEVTFKLPTFPLTIVELLAKRLVVVVFVPVALNQESPEAVNISAIKFRKYPRVVVLLVVEALVAIKSVKVELPVTESVPERIVFKEAVR